jgi:hypothetical protein
VICTEVCPTNCAVNKRDGWLTDVTGKKANVFFGRLAQDRAKRLLRPKIWRTQELVSQPLIV